MYVSNIYGSCVLGKKKARSLQGDWDKDNHRKETQYEIAKQQKQKQEQIHADRLY